MTNRLFIVLVVGGAIIFGIGTFLGAGIQWDHDKKKITATIDENSCFDRGSLWGMHVCAKDPLYWECLSEEQQNIAKQYAKEHAK